MPRQPRSAAVILSPRASPWVPTMGDHVTLAGLCPGALLCPPHLLRFPEHETQNMRPTALGVLGHSWCWAHGQCWAHGWCWAQGQCWACGWWPPLVTNTGPERGSVQRSTHGEQADGPHPEAPQLCPYMGPRGGGSVSVLCLGGGRQSRRAICLVHLPLGRSSPASCVPGCEGAPRGHAQAPAMLYPQLSLRGGCRWLLTLGHWACVLCV